MTIELVEIESGTLIDGAIEQLAALAQAKQAICFAWFAYTVLVAHPGQSLASIREQEDATWHQQPRGVTQTAVMDRAELPDDLATLAEQMANQALASGDTALLCEVEGVTLLALPGLTADFILRQHHALQAALTPARA